MTEANILDDDYVVIQSGNSHRDDDIVVVLIKNENAVTLKLLKQPSVTIIMRQLQPII
jgi:SOS-response transcriptional repressor LexA